jgi:hypothetical protein
MKRQRKGEKEKIEKMEKGKDRGKWKKGKS